MKRFALSTFLYFFRTVCFSQIIAPSGSSIDNIEGVSDDIFIPGTPSTGWYIDKSKVRKEAMMMFNVKKQKIYTLNNGKILIINDLISEFGFINKNGLDRRFVFLDLPKVDFFEIFGYGLNIQILVNYAQYESQSNSYGDVAKNIKQLESVYYINSKNGIKKIKLNKKELLKYFHGNENLKNYLKSQKNDFKVPENLNDLILFLNQKL